MTKLSVGDRVNKLVILERVRLKDKWRGAWFRVQCDCGTVKEVRSGGLNSGRIKSCGCILRELAKTKRLGKFKFGQEHVGKSELFNRYRQRAHKQGVAFSLSSTEFRHLTGLPCHYCGRKPYMHARTLYHGQTTTSAVYNGIDRMTPIAGYTLDNCVACCWTCNQAKSSMTKDQFLSWIKMVAIHSQNALKDLEPTHPPHNHPSRKEEIKDRWLSRIKLSRQPKKQNSTKVKAILAQAYNSSSDCSSRGSAGAGS